MVGSSGLAPLLTGHGSNLAIRLSGVATLLFFVVTGGRLKSCLGSSFATKAVVIAAIGNVGAVPNPYIPSREAGSSRRRLSTR